MKHLKLYEEFNFNIPFLNRDKNIPEKYREVYRQLKKIFKGPCTVEFISDYVENWRRSLSQEKKRDYWKNRTMPNVKTEAIIEVRGKDERKNYYCNREGIEQKRFYGSVVLTFYLDRNLQDIINWINEDKLKRKNPELDPYQEEDWDDKVKKSELEDFIDNFDAYQGDYPIDPTPEAPYEYLDLDD